MLGLRPFRGLRVGRVRACLASTIFRRRCGFFQHGTGLEHILIEGHIVVIGHEDGALQRFRRKGAVPDVGVGVVDEHGIYIALALILPVALRAYNAAAHI